jgi:hypothetical protein
MPAARCAQAYAARRLFPCGSMAPSVSSPRQKWWKSAAEAWRNQAEEKEPDRLVDLQKLPLEWAVLADQRRQLAEEEHVYPLSISVGQKEPEDRLGQQEGVKRVLAPVRREPHRRRHVNGPIGQARELAPNKPTECHDPHSHAE